MKLSIAWIFDHIGVDWKTVDIPLLVEKFNRTTAEIESYEKVSLDVDSFRLAQVKTIDANCIVLICPEKHEDFALPIRTDAKVGKWYLIKYDKSTYRWAIPGDFGSDKDGYLPDFHVDSHKADGSWKKQLDAEDYILDIDNKSITHRPDLWGHRGFAREIAAILDVPFEPLDKFVKKTEIKQYDTQADAVEGNPFKINLETKDADRFAGMFVAGASPRPSSLWMGSRLLRVGVRAISFYVDITNYVMLDTSEPMHAFDANFLESKSIHARKAKKGEKLLLLDDSTLTLTENDMVIADGETPVSLAGIMGGKGSGIGKNTSMIFFEAAHFDAATIRKSSARHKIRTESSMRFEKSLDPNQNITALQRTLMLMDEEHIEYTFNGEITSVGKPAEPQLVQVSHEFIETCLGVAIPEDFIYHTLTKLQFGVEMHKADGKSVYTVTIPTFRATKDIEMPEDIVEEIGRFWGYEKIPYELPLRQMKPADNTVVTIKHDIKNHCAFALNMREVNNYPVFDEGWLAKIGYDPKDSVTLKNPLSENATRMATSLVPHLLRNVEQNKSLASELRFFEMGRKWWMTPKEAHEQRTLSGICWQQDGNIDFYQLKQELTSLFNLLRIDVTWVKGQGNLAPWYSQHQTAFLMHKNKTVGTVGMADPGFLGSLVEGNALIFEIDADFLEEYKAADLKYTPISKYPYVWLDVSMFAPLEKTVDKLQSIIKATNSAIYKVELKDLFEKEEWGDKRSVTMRFYMRDKERTLRKDDIDAIYANVTDTLHKQGIEIR